MNAKPRSLSVMAVAIATLGGSCVGDPDVVFRRGEMLQALGENVIVPTYRAFETQAAALEASSRAFCDAPSTDTLGALENDFHTAKQALRHTDAFAIGPHVDAPLRLGPKVDDWPARPSAVESVLASDTPLDGPALDGVGTTSKGFPAIDYLLFLPDDPVEAFADERRCAYLVALAENVASRAGDFVTAWAPDQDDYAGTLRRGDDPFEGVQSAASTLVEHMIFNVENIRELRIARPAGRTRATDTPDPTLLESPHSARSLQDAIDSLASSENIYLGRFGGADGLGVQDWLIAFRADLDPMVLRAFGAAREALESIRPRSLWEAIENEDPAVDAAFERLTELQILLEADVAGALAITVTFNPVDGD